MVTLHWSTALTSVHGLIMHMLPGGCLNVAINSSDLTALKERVISESRIGGYVEQAWSDFGH